MTNEEKVKKRIKNWERACKKEKKKEKKRILNACKRSARENMKLESVQSQITRKEWGSANHPARLK